MSIHVQIIHNNKNISLSEALEDGLVTIFENKIQAVDETTTLSLSSKLFDCKGNELFENDIVQSIEGKKYKIIYNFGMFYLLELETKTITPLYIYKMGNTIDVEKIIN